MNIFDQIGSAFASDFVSGPTVNPQYQPPKRPWVGLTVDEINEVFGADIRDEPSGELLFIRAIEVKLREKNSL